MQTGPASESPLTRAKGTTIRVLIPADRDLLGRRVQGQVMLVSYLQASNCYGAYVQLQK